MHNETETKIRIGTRGSKLALAQAYQTRDRLIAAHPLTEDEFDIVIKTPEGTGCFSSVVRGPESPIHFQERAASRW
jgi:hypothetical protein